MLSVLLTVFKIVFIFFRCIFVSGTIHKKVRGSPLSSGDLIWMIIFMMIIFSIICIWQYRLSKSEKRMSGLKLPGLSIILSVLITALIILYLITGPTGSTVYADENYTTTVYSDGRLDVIYTDSGESVPFIMHEHDDRIIDNEYGLYDKSGDNWTLILTEKQLDRLRKSLIKVGGNFDHNYRGVILLALILIAVLNIPTYILLIIFFAARSTLKARKG